MKNIFSTVKTSYSIKDCSIFYPGIEATGVSLSPPECIVDASSQVEVQVSLNATPDRLQNLLQKPSETVIKVVGLTVTYGDEATLHRLRR